jgi:hypothetical protein
MTPMACNTLAGIESGKLALCPDGSPMDETNCEDAGQGGSGGSGSSSSSSSGGGASTVCEAPWQRGDSISGRCYLQEFGTREWAAAEQRCVDLGGHLLAIDSANELAQIADWMGTEVWIGGTDANNEGAFAWTNGQAWSFATWKDGAPMDPSGNRDCVLLAKPIGSLPAFDCRQCTEKRAYICESEPINP